MDKLTPALQGQGRWKYAWFAAIAVVLGMQTQCLWRPTPDAAAYLSIGRSIAHGNLTCHGNPHLYYWPGYPLAISPAFLLSERPFLAISILHWCFAMAIMAGVWVWMGHLRCGPLCVQSANPVADGTAAPPGPDAAWLRWRAMAVALMLVNTGFWDSYRHTLGETLFMVLMVWAPLVALSAVRASGRAGAIFLTVLAAVLSTWLCAVRSVGVFVVMGIAISLAAAAWRKNVSKIRASLVAGLISVLAIAVTSAIILHEQAMRIAYDNGGITYMEQLRGNGNLASQLLEGLRLRISEVGRLLVPGMVDAYAKSGKWINFTVIFYCGIFTAVLAGWWRLARRNADALLWAFPPYLVLYIVWPYDQSVRFMTPMLPVLWVSALAAMDWAFIFRGRIFLGDLPDKRRQAMMLVLCVLLIGHMAMGVVYWRKWTSQLVKPSLWQTAAVLAAGVTQDRHNGVIDKPAKDIQWVMIFQLDRNWPIASKYHGKPTRWIVSDKPDIGQTTVVRAEHGGYYLLERVPQPSN